MRSSVAFRGWEPSSLAQSPSLAEEHDLSRSDEPSAPFDVRALEPAERQLFDEVHALETLSWKNIFYRSVFKPALDRVLASILLIILSPLMLLLAAAVRITLGKGIFYVQQRVGKGGAQFPMRKFRTMRHDRRIAQTPFSGNERRLCHKRADDPRHTRLGRFMRRRSLDELPQLWNVVCGDMSLVGPRPELPNIVQTYEPWQHLRHLVKPGITGLWQVTARNDGELLHNCTNLDVAYAREVSFRGDLSLVLATLRVVVDLGQGGS